MRQMRRSANINALQLCIKHAAFWTMAATSLTRKLRDNMVLHVCSNKES
jgi:hypothetical protein